MRVKEVGKQGNAINLYYLNLLRSVTLRPLVVIFLGGDGAGLGTAHVDAPPPDSFCRLFFRWDTGRAFLLRC
jgi:hypothetical protein